MLMNYTKACNPYSGFSAPVNGTSAIGCAEKALFSVLSRHVSHYRLCIKDGRKIEPACGSGNFMVAALNRKVNTIKLRYYGDRVSFERALVLAVSTLYGVDIQPDNVAECRSRLLQEALSACGTWSHRLEHALRFVLQHNVLAGNTLHLADLQGRPLVFAEWKMLPDGTMVRKDYTLAEILHHSGEYNDPIRKQYCYGWMRGLEDDRKQADQIKGKSSGARRSIYEPERGQCYAGSREAGNRAD
jgi:hypothetical protein